MAKTPNTRPEQITDKNGKVTTVHKSNGAKSKKGDKARTPVQATPPHLLRQDRINSIVESVAHKARQSQDPLLVIREAIETVEDVSLTDLRRSAVETVTEINPNVAGIKLGVDVLGQPIYAGAIDAEGNDIDFRVDENIAWWVQRDVALIALADAKGKDRPEKIYFSEGGEQSPEGRELFAGEEDLMNAFEARDVVREMYDLLNRESRKKLGEDLRAIDPEITGVYCSEEWGTPSHTLMMNDSHHISTRMPPISAAIYSVILGNGEFVRVSEHKEARRIAEVLNGTRKEDLLNPYLHGAVDTIEF